MAEFKPRRQFNLLTSVLFVHYEKRVSVQAGEIYGWDYK